MLIVKDFVPLNGKNDMPKLGKNANRNIRLIWKPPDSMPELRRTYGACPTPNGIAQTFEGPNILDLTISITDSILCDNLKDDNNKFPTILASPNIKNIKISKSSFENIWFKWIGNINAGTKGTVKSHYIQITKYGDDFASITAYLLIRTQMDRLSYVRYFHAGINIFSELSKGQSVEVYNALMCNPEISSAQGVFNSELNNCIIKAG